MVNCPYCHKEAKFTDSKVVYGKSYGMIYLCKPCDAYVGVHKDSKKPLGTPAKSDLRHLRKAAHTIFDPLWKVRRKPRHRLYAWMAETLNIPPQEAHIAMLDERQCKNLIFQIMKMYY